MASDEVAAIDLQLDASQAHKELSKIAQSLSDLSKMVGRIGDGMTKAFEPAVKAVGNLEAGACSLSNVVGNVGAELQALQKQLSNAQGEDRVWSVVDTVSTGISTTVTALASAADIEKLFEKIDFTPLKDRVEELRQSITNKIGGIWTSIAESMSPGALAESIGNVANKLKESAIQWGFELKAKAASRLEDLKIIAINTVEHVKAFGLLIAQLAASAGAWIAETAAKAASTAAQWAQIAATTAWQAICVAATAVTTAFGAAVAFLTSPIGLVIVGIAALIAIVVLLVKNWDTVSAKAQEVWSFVEGLFVEFDAFLQGVFAEDFTEQFGAFGNVLNAFFANVENIWNAVKSIFGGIIDFVKNVFAGDWGAAWDSVVGIFKGVWELLVSIVKVPINGIIGLINGLTQGVVDRINIVIRALNSISFDVPDWVPVIGGQTFGFNLKLLKAPKIPYLAKGAVLPANKPFLAVVGDQKHGTNIEAPLTTIQEAVGLVMGDHIAAMMAGFEALLKEQQATRQAIAAIEVGDTVIGRAAERYGRKMAVVRGGF
ncbi:MAG: hypothetical protein IJO04_04675 [Oscillospiraceae bacterium]|nr:hypothetical protein [Oscillospiraceae bacterium]